MSILSAMYVEGEERSEVTPQQIPVQLYEFKYKGNLYCTTEGCDAKIVYVHKTGSASYFRTWKHDDHIENCPHRFHREMGRAGVSNEPVLYVQASPGKKSKAMDDAYALATRSETERQAIRPFKRPRNSPATSDRVRSVQTVLAILDGIEETALPKGSIRSPRIFKRDAKEIKDTDLGTARLVYGVITQVEERESDAVICLDGGSRTVHVRYPEAFFADNQAYKGLFHHVQRYMSEYQNVVFTGIGELKSRKDGDVDLFIYRGQDFKIQKSSLLELAASYSSGLWEWGTVILIENRM